MNEVPSEEEVTRIKEEASEAKKNYQSERKEKKRSKSYCSYERKEPVKLLALEQTIKVLAEKSNAAVEVFDRAEFELDIVTAVSNALTQEELAEEGEMFLKRCGQGISLVMLNLGLKKNNKGWWVGIQALMAKTSSTCATLPTTKSENNLKTKNLKKRISTVIRRTPSKTWDYACNA